MRGLGFSWLGPAAAIALGVSVAFAGGASDYPACTQKASKNDVEAAQASHKLATEWNDRGDYDKAISLWRDAYKLDCSAHALLINIANAYEKKGDRASAVAALETYLARTGGGNTTIAEKVTNLKNLIKAQSETSPPNSSSSATPAASTAPAPTPTPVGERPYGIAPVGVIIGGGALTLVGAILLPIGFGSISSAESACPSHLNCSNAVASEGNTGRTEAGVGWTTLGLGVAAVGGGLVWQFMYNKPAEATAPKQGFTVRPAPIVGPGVAGASVSGTF